MTNKCICCCYIKEAYSLIKTSIFVSKTTRRHIQLALSLVLLIMCGLGCAFIIIPIIGSINMLLAHFFPNIEHYVNVFYGVNVYNHNTYVILLASGFIDVILLMTLMFIAIIIYCCFFLIYYIITNIINFCIIVHDNCSYKG